ncbi:MAG TPA: hypothetical protein DEA55_08095 [Rhodospirillaceae bacterium]|nr:hypothetical protein [Rhodospirillaceae bacterium]
MGDNSQEFNDKSRGNRSMRLSARRSTHTAKQVFECWAQGDPFIPRNMIELSTMPEFCENALENIDNYARITSNGEALDLCMKVAAKSYMSDKLLDSLLEKAIGFATACKNAGLNMDKANNALFDIYRLSPHKPHIRAHAEALIPAYGEYAEMLSNHKLREMVDSGIALYKVRAFPDDAPPDVRPYTHCLRND